MKRAIVTFIVAFTLASGSGAVMQYQPAYSPAPNSSSSKPTIDVFVFVGLVVCLVTYIVYHEHSVRVKPAKKLEWEGKI